MAAPKATYSVMVFDAIKALKERNGSSLPALKKQIMATYPALNFTPHQMRSALKKGVESGKFIKVKSSYKLSAEAKKPAPKPKKKVVKKKVVKKVKKVVKKKVAKKPAAKKATTKKAAPKKTGVKKTVTKKKPAAAKKATTPKKKAAPKKAAPKKD
eukprot:TRINITY_DN713_c0_g2_i1.p1 TRINITY_DN713_c0_g2~~TRINITY_DN713_c0_g2_i1.p1  ORF type:complete len:179 (-),score=68.98 TRINITY_DN713_c0_g2_i1:944-1411(-)